MACDFLEPGSHKPGTYTLSEGAFVAASRRHCLQLICDRPAQGYRIADGQPERLHRDLHTVFELSAVNLNGPVIRRQT